MTTLPRAQQPPSEHLGPYVLVALLGHAGVIVGLVALERLIAMFGPPEPDFTADDVIEVIAVNMPAATFSPIPQNATKATPSTAPEAQPVPSAAEPPPPVQSDLAFRTDKAEVPSNTPPNPKAPTAPAADAKADTTKMKALMDDLNSMDDLLDELADDGSRNRASAGPEVDPANATGRVYVGGISDPELKRYIDTVSKLISEHHSPLPALVGQGLVTVVRVKVGDDGTLLEQKLEKSCGNPSFDRSAVAAVADTRRVPALPSKYHDGHGITFLVKVGD